MNKARNPFDPENLQITPEQLASRQAKQKKDSTVEIWGGVPVEITHFIWDQRLQKFVPKGEVPSRSPKIQDEWHRFSYLDLLTLAKASRNVLIAVLAELHHLHYQSFDKSKPVVLGNTFLQALGFHRSSKNLALKELEKAGWITVEWRTRKSPLITFVRKPDY